MIAVPHFRRCGHTQLDLRSNAGGTGDFQTIGRAKEQLQALMDVFQSNSRPMPGPLAFFLDRDKIIRLEQACPERVKLVRGHTNAIIPNLKDQFALSQEASYQNRARADFRLQSMMDRIFNNGLQRQRRHHIILRKLSQIVQFQLQRELVPKSVILNTDIVFYIFQSSRMDDSVFL